MKFSTPWLRTQHSSGLFSFPVTFKLSLNKNPCCSIYTWWSLTNTPHDLKDLYVHWHLNFRSILEWKTRWYNSVAVQLISTVQSKWNLKPASEAAHANILSLASPCCDITLTRRDNLQHKLHCDWLTPKITDNLKHGFSHWTVYFGPLPRSQC